MSTVIATSVLPDSTANDTLTIGATGDSVVIGGNLLTMNTLQDAGGNTIFVSDGSGAITSAPNFPGAMKLISSQTASNAATVSFTSGIDSTYDVYLFKFVNVNPATDDVDFSFQGNVVGASGYNETITSSSFRTYHDESNTAAALSYDGNADQGQGTAFQLLNRDCGNDADQSSAGELYLFSPSSTTYVKHFYARTNVYTFHDFTATYFIAGYFNVTGAIDDIQFKMSSGNFDGIISLYGISKT